MKIKIKDLVLDDDIYPRKIMLKDGKTKKINYNQNAIDSYEDALKGGITFDPIEAQKVIKNGIVVVEND